MKNVLNVVCLCFISFLLVNCSSNNTVNANAKTTPSTDTIDDDDKMGENEKTIAISELPESVIQYITINHADATIKEAEVNDTNYEVELSNHMELIFDKEGNFKEIEKENDVDEDSHDDDK